MNRLVLFSVPALGLLLSLSSGAQEPAVHTPAQSLPSSQAGIRPSAVALASRAKNDEKKVTGKVLVLHASNSGGGVDPELRNLPQLKHPPFSSYDTYHLLSKQSIELTKSRFATTKLPNGRVLKTSLKEILPDGRYQVVASISKKKKKGKKDESFLPLLRVTAKGGETFFVAGQSYKKGILVIGIRVGEPSKGKSGGHKKK